MLSPKRTKYRKRNRSSASLTGNAHRGNTIAFGDFGRRGIKWNYIMCMFPRLNRRVGLFGDF